MIKLIYKSKLLREEIKTWVAIAGLALWGVTATAWALTRREQIVLVGMDEAGTRVITNSSDRLVQNELKVFLKYFFEMQYSYNEGNFKERLSFASDLYSEKLWQEQRPKIVELGEKLKKTPLTQSVEIISLDRLDNANIEAVINLKIRSRLSEQTVKLKVNLAYKKIERHEKNPWGYEVDEINETLL